LFASRFVIRFGKQAGDGIAGELWGKAGDGVQGAFADACGALRIGLLGFRKSVAQTERIELIDSEDSDATVRTTGTASQPFAAALRGVGQGGVDDLDELLIAGGRGHR